MLAPLSPGAARALLTPAARLLALSAMPEPDAAFLRLVEPSQVHWASLLALAQFERAEQGVLDVLRAMRAEEVPSSVRKALDMAARVGQFRAMELQQGAAAACDAFRAAQVPALWMKGAALAMQHPRGFAVRGMGDIDVLVAPDRRDDAVEAVRAAGWMPDGDAATYTGHHHEAPFVRGDGLRLELHTAVFPPGHPFLDVDAAAWLARSREVEWSGRPVRVPDSAWHVVHAATHWAWSHETEVGTWQWLHDCWRLAGSWPEGDLRWAALQRHAAAIGAQRPVGWALWYAERIGGVPVPHRVIAALRGPADAARGLTERVWVTRTFAPSVASPSVRWSRAWWRRAMGGLGDAGARYPWIAGRTAAVSGAGAAVDPAVPRSGTAGAAVRYLRRLFGRP